MSAKNTETTEQTDPKPSFVDRVKQSNITAKAKNIAAVVGAVTVVGVAAAAIAKKKSVGVEVTLPDLDVTSDV